MLPPRFDASVRAAVTEFWKVRRGQAKRQVGATAAGQGGRASVTGGAQMDGFARLLHKLLVQEGVPKDSIFLKQAVELPGYYRPTKKWDLLVVWDHQLVAAMEFKSQVGPSFGNNFNNRTEEAIGSAADLQAAYREGAFKPSAKPWLGYLMLLEEEARSVSPVAVDEPHFKVFKEFKGASYAKRYELLCLRLVRENLYSASSLLLTARFAARTGMYSEPNPELSVAGFATSLLGLVAAFKARRAEEKR